MNTGIIGLPGDALGIMERRSVPLILPFEGGGAVIATGQYHFLRMTYPASISAWELYADQSGSIVIDLWRCERTRYPPVAADTICGAQRPTLSSQVRSELFGLTNWQAALKSGDVLFSNVVSVTTLTKAWLVLHMHYWS